MIKNIFKSLTILFFFTYAFGQVEMAKIENFETNINLYNVNSNFWRLSVSKQNAAFRNLTAIPTIADMFAGEVCLYNSGDDYRLYTRIGNSILHALFNITETTNTWTATQNFAGITARDIGVGTTNPEDIFHIVDSGFGAVPILLIDDYSATTSASSSMYFRKSHSSTKGVKIETINIDVLGDIRFMGVNNESNFALGAFIYVYQIGAAGVNIPTIMQLYTYNDSGANSNQLVLTPAGNVTMAGTLTTGGSDPPYTQYWAEDRNSIIDYVKANIPPQYLDGATLFFNKNTEQFEYFRADKGEFRSFRTNEVVANVIPIIETFEVNNFYTFNQNSGKIQMWSHRKNTSYKIKENYKLNENTGEFWEIEKDTTTYKVKTWIKKVSKDKAIENK